MDGNLDLGRINHLHRKLYTRFHTTVLFARLKATQVIHFYDTSVDPIYRIANNAWHWKTWIDRANHVPRWKIRSENRNSSNLEERLTGVGIGRSVKMVRYVGECLLCAVGGWQTRVRFLAAIKGLLRVSLASKHRQIRKFVARPSFSKWIISISAKWPSGLPTSLAPLLPEFSNVSTL